jgi:hypothetical protein
MVIWLFVTSCGSGTGELEVLNEEVQQTEPLPIAMDSLTGLVVAEHFELVRAQCTVCHSAKLITQNNASKDGWEQMIRWMQKDQGLWDLGENEDHILNYLSQYYGLKKKGRRTPLTDIEWYVLDP